MSDKGTKAEITVGLAIEGIVAGVVILLGVLAILLWVFVGWSPVSPLTGIAMQVGGYVWIRWVERRRARLAG